MCGGGRGCWRGMLSGKYFSYFSMTIKVVGTHKKCLSEAFLMSIYMFFTEK